MLNEVPLTAFQTEKVRALLIYLAVEPQPHQRSALAQLLWPGYTAESANASLRQTLVRLRQLLDDHATTPSQTPWLLTTRQTVQINPTAAIEVDVTTFTRLFSTCATHAHSHIERCQPCLACLRQAVDLYQGDFLSGFTVADSNDFEEWRRIIQEQVHLQILDAFTHLAAAAESAGDDDAALQLAHRQLALEPWQESAHRCIMRVLAQRGQRSAALAQYNRCRQILAEEFGGKPEAETTALAEQIQRAGADKVVSRQDDKKIGRQEAHSSPLVSPAHALPSFLSPLVGRAQALEEISNRLHLPEVCLLTLVGPGGMGKTRLAVEVGRKCMSAFVDGVFFVPLAAINTPGAVAPAIATVLGLPLQGGEPRAALLHALRQKQILLILDNFEHLLEDDTAIALVVEIMAMAPRVQLLVTSRERLNLRNEHIYTVQALAFTTNAGLSEAAGSSAVRLFVQSAQRNKGDFQLTAANSASVLRICRLVHGMPLGLELAAANVGLLPLQEIADAIEKSAEFLTVDWRDMPQRQRSMRAVFTWSWQLLNAQEQTIFRQLAIFQGSFTRSAAEQIAGATLPLLARLMNKSLIHVADPTLAEGRYQIHELLRQFAAGELANAQEESATAYRHSAYYLSLLAAQQRPIMHDAPRAGVQAIHSEMDNIRQAWRWGAAHLPAALVEQCAIALREFYWLTGLTTEAIEMFTLAAQARREHLHNQSVDLAAEARLCSILIALSAAFQISIGHHDEALEGALNTLQLADEQTNPVGSALGYMVKGQALRRLGQSEEAFRLLAQSVTLSQQTRAKLGNLSLLLELERRACSWLASIALSNDDFAAAKAYSIYQLEICQQFELKVGEAASLTCLIEIDEAFGDYAQARQRAEHALSISQQTDFLWGQAVCAERLAEIVRAQGDYHQAQTSYEQALHLYRLMNRTLEESTITHLLGRLYLRLGDATHARTWIDQGFQLLKSLGFPARETFWATSSRARLGYLTDDLPQALADAEQALKMARQLDGAASQADALVLLGLVRERMQQANAAANAYSEALAIYVNLGHHYRAAESRAGLARLALAIGAPTDAMREVEEILTILHSHPLAGFDEPFQVYLTCHAVLTAHQDSRAAVLITTAHDLLMTYAARLPDPKVRRTFCEDIVIHSEVQKAFMSGQDDKLIE
ncbi:MAG: BTAD domain-containing putative transcriptional regulator [Caldilineaceae bacterium]